MGTRVAPTFANLFMARFEKLHVYTHTPRPDLWLRFIDDIFMIWSHGRDSLDQFVRHLNTVHDTIKFTMEVSSRQVHFLDMTVQLEGPSISTTLYQKPTDTNNLLHYQSAHPIHCRTGIPYGQFLRLRRLCTHFPDFVTHGLAKAKQFLDRGYPLDLLSREMLRAAILNRGDLFIHSSQSTPTGNMAPTTTPTTHTVSPPTHDQQIMVTTYHPSFKGLGPLISDNWSVLGNSHRTQYLHQRRLITGLRRPPNFKEMLVRARTDFHPQDTTHQSNDPHPHTRTYNICSTKDCRYCARLDTGGTIISKTTGRSYKTKMNVSCKSSNLIYCIECTRCGSQYVGQTERKLMSRAGEHFTKITHSKLGTDMGKHFCTPPHMGLQDVKLYILDFIHCNPQSPAAALLRDQIESNWIHTLRCLAPQGLNLKDTPKFRKSKS